MQLVPVYGRALTRGQSFNHTVNLMKQYVILMIVALIIGMLSSSLYAQAMTAEQAAELARQKTGGKVLKVEQQNPHLYYVKVLMPQGQVRHITIKAERPKPPHSRQ